jgi:hypothetical protein
VNGPTGVRYCSKSCSPNGPDVCNGAGCHSTNVSDLYVCGLPGTTPSPSPSPSPPPATSSDGGVPPGAPPPPGNPTPDPDSAPPKVTITFPAEGAVVKKSFTLQATVTDKSGVKWVDVLLDGKLLTAKGAPPFNFPVVLPVGKHTLRLEAKDTVGNGGSGAVTVFVEADTAPPTPDPPSPPTPPAPKAGYGEACQLSRDCASNLCANDLTLQQQYCTQTCAPGADPCPVGSDCFAAASGVHVCAPLAPDPSGGTVGGRPVEKMSCAMGGGTPDPLLVLVLVGLLGGCLRRRLFAP